MMTVITYLTCACVRIDLFSQCDPKTVQLHGYRNQISGRLPTEFGRLKYLESLHLDHNKISGRIPTEFGQMNSLGKSHLTWFASLSIFTFSIPNIFMCVLDAKFP